MINLKSKSDCCGCRACEQICPVNAITMHTDKEGFIYPSVDESKCINCGKCDNACPNIIPAKVSDNSLTYACYIKDIEKRIESQSGGIFAAISEYVLEKSGVVFGAAFDDNWHLKHRYIDNTDDLHLLKGSKYLQSNIQQSYRETLDFLKQGKLVLFSGTPCQIQGLTKFLGKGYGNLITVDLICHGVPSPMVWENYLDEFVGEKKLVEFKQKDKLKSSTINYKFSDGSIRIENYDQNPYSRGFSKNLFLRPSCYYCKFKGVERCSDFTIGDFWGIEKYHPEFFDKFGISVAFLHSEKSEIIFDEIKDKIEYIKCEQEMVFPENINLNKAALIPKKRQKFFDEYNEKGFAKTVEDLLKPTLSETITSKANRIKVKIKFFIKKILKKNR